MPALQGSDGFVFSILMHCRSTCGTGVILVRPILRYEKDSKENASEGGSRAFANALRVTWAQAGMPVLLKSRGLTIGCICSMFCID